MRFVFDLNLAKLRSLFLALACICILISEPVSAQSSPRPSQISNPEMFYLTTAPDARSAGMGEAGVASSPDANATYWNASKIAFAEKDFGASVTYKPHLRNLIDGVWMGYASAYKRLEKGQAVALSLNYFNQTNIYSGLSSQNRNPMADFAVGATYSKQLGTNFSIGVTLKYISASLAEFSTTSGIFVKNGKTVAGDISAYYRKQLINNGSGKMLEWSAGVVVSNLGDKVSFSGGIPSYVLPTTLKIGGGLSFAPNTHHKFSFILDASKLAIPNNVNALGQTVFSGIIKSFSDAPGGFKEEMQEVVWSGGAEYQYKNTYTLRTGYFGENKNKGGRKYFTAGTGVRFLKTTTSILLIFFQLQQILC